MPWDEATWREYFSEFTKGELLELLYAERDRRLKEKMRILRKYGSQERIPLQNSKQNREEEAVPCIRR